MDRGTAYTDRCHFYWAGIMNNKKIIISLGGSLIHPKSIDVEFCKAFKQLIEAYLTKGYQFIIYCGGGALARTLQESASSIQKLSDEQKDWLGIEATKINAYFIKSIFDEKNTYELIISDPTQPIETTKPLIICSGWKPGWSTDYDAVLIAKNQGSDTIINMSNIDYVYDKDPNKHDDAQKIKEISWKDFQKLVGEKWSPGLNMPFDPIASKEAAKNKNKVIIIGKDLKNLENALQGNDFEGTIIQ